MYVLFRPTVCPTTRVETAAGVPSGIGYWLDITTAITTATPGDTSLHEGVNQV